MRPRENRSVPPNTVLPHIYYEDVEAANTWLTKNFGFREQYRYGDPISGAQMRLGGVWIMLHSAKVSHTSPARIGYGTQSLTVFISDVEAHFERAKSAEAKILEVPNETVYGEWQYAVEDLEGHHWLFSQHARDLSPDEWGAVVSESKGRLGVLPRPRWCYLEIPAIDVSKSVSFYEDVFGWSVRHRDSTRPAFDDATGNVSGTWVTHREVARQSGLLAYIWVDSIEISLSRVRAHGGEVVNARSLDHPGGDSCIATIRDVAGNLIGLYEEEGAG